MSEVFTVIYRRYEGTNVGPAKETRWNTLKDACLDGAKEFKRGDNYDAHLRLPSGTTLMFTKMFGLI
jgi:hypothetical protein